MFNLEVWAIILLLVWLFTTTTVATTPIAKAGCPTKCGKVTIPYPFGFKADGSCSMNQLFTIKCNNSFNPPKPFLPTPSGDFEILQINNPGVRIKYNSLSMQCFNRKGNLTANTTGEILNLTTTPFVISSTKNMFYTVGCSDVGMFFGLGDNDQIGGCVALNYGNQTITDESCVGLGCCHINIAKQMKTYSDLVIGLLNHSFVNCPCGYSFLGEMDKFKFRGADLYDSEFANRTRDNVPIVLEYVVDGNRTCDQAKKNGSSYACQQNTKCVDSNSGFGSYSCICLQGYEGNPYLSPGCTDIDECAASNNTCLKSKYCTNVPGSFKCSCPTGEDGNAYKNGTGCTSNIATHTTKLLIGVIVGLVLFVMFISWAYFAMRRRKLMKLREKFFIQNGGILLKQKLSPNGESMDLCKIFTMDELKVATNNYSEDQVLGRGGHGIVYKGILKDGQEVAIKKSKIVEQSQIEQFINEVIILTQINHRNVVKLLGCCLETEVPMLVYEFIPNVNLYEHIHKKYDDSWLTWENCVKLATETADALGYLHSATSIPVIHRDVKSANILINDFYTAKISDFGASRLIPIDQTQVTTLVQGTLGYLDPEYFMTSQLTEKSDVYSFGIVLAELMTKEKPLCFDKNINLATHFISAMEENRLIEIIDHRLVREVSKEQIITMAMLIKNCLNIRGKDRPTMKEVARQLNGLKKIEQPWAENDHEKMINYRKLL